MAEIQTEVLTIKVSKLAASGEKLPLVLTDEIREAIEALAKELLFEVVGTHIVIEAEASAD